MDARSSPPLPRACDPVVSSASPPRIGQRSPRADVQPGTDDGSNPRATERAAPRPRSPPSMLFVTNLGIRDTDALRFKPWKQARPSAVAACQARPKHKSRSSSATTVGPRWITRLRKGATGCAPGQKHGRIERWRAADEQAAPMLTGELATGRKDASGCADTGAPVRGKAQAGATPS
jgi:hypothetical protein